METLVIDKNNFLRSVSIANDTSEGGYSPAKGGHNLVKEQGVWYGQPASTDLSTNLEGNVIAKADDNNDLGNDKYLLDDEGKFYTLNGATLTKRQAGTKTYRAGTSDLINFQGVVFATSETDIAMLTGGDLGTLDETWLTGTLGKTALKSGNRHHMVVVEDTLYIADGDLIHTWDGTTFVHSAMTLPSQRNITTMIKHPNGRDLLVFSTNSSNYSGTIATPSFMQVIDTLRLEFTRDVPLQDMVTGGINISGRVYVGYGTNLGIVTDGGVQFIRKLNIARGGDTLAYKQHFDSFGDHLLVIEAEKVLAYGDLGHGDVFWYPIEHTAAGNIDSVFGIGDNKICYATQESGTEKLFKLDFDDAGLSTFRSNPISFARPVWIRRIDIIHTKTSGSTFFDLVNVDQSDGDVVIIKNISYSSPDEVKKTRVDCNLLVDTFQFYLTQGINPLGIKKFIIYYESAE